MKYVNAEEIRKEFENDFPVTNLIKWDGVKYVRNTFDGNQFAIERNAMLKAYKKAIDKTHIKITELKKNLEIAVKAVKAYQKLNLIYRTGKRPSEKLFKELEKAGNFLNKLQEEHVGI